MKINKIFSVITLSVMLTASPVFAMWGDDNNKIDVNKEVPCKLPNGQTLQMTPSQCSDRGGQTQQQGTQNNLQNQNLTGQQPNK